METYWVKKKTQSKFDVSVCLVSSSFIILFAVWLSWSNNHPQMSVNGVLVECRRPFNILKSTGDLHTHFSLIICVTAASIVLSLCKYISSNLVRCLSYSCYFSSFSSLLDCAPSLAHSQLYKHVSIVFFFLEYSFSYSLNKHLHTAAPKRDCNKHLERAGMEKKLQHHRQFVIFIVRKAAGLLTVFVVVFHWYFIGIVYHVFEFLSFVLVLLLLLIQFGWCCCSFVIFFGWRGLELFLVIIICLYQFFVLSFSPFAMTFCTQQHSSCLPVVTRVRCFCFRDFEASP